MLRVATEPTLLDSLSKRTAKEKMNQKRRMPGEQLKNGNKVTGQPST